MQDTKKSYYAVITADVLYSEEINDSQKILMAIISNLANEKGYCFALNPHLAELRGKSETSISRDIKALTDAGFLGRADWIEKDGRLLCRALTPLLPTPEGVTQKWGGGFPKSGTHNNKLNTLSKEEEQKTDLTPQEKAFINQLGIHLNARDNYWGSRIRKKHDIKSTAQAKEIINAFIIWYIGRGKSAANYRAMQMQFSYFESDELNHKFKTPPHKK